MNVEVFKAETQILTASYPEDFTVLTEQISPLLDKNITLYFKASNEACDRKYVFDDNRKRLSFFSLALIKSPTSKCYPSLVMSIDASVYYSDGTLYKKYEPRSNIKIDQLISLGFESDVQDINETSDNRYSGHSFKMRGGNLILRYKMSFHVDVSKTPSPEIAKSSFPNFSNALKCVYESAVFSDFVFKVGDKSFPVHKVILVAHSPVFLKMLTQDFKESKTNSVTITDATPEAFEMFLKYLYSGKIDDKSWPSVKELYSLADKYDVGILKNECVDIAISLLSLDLVCDILKLAYTYDDSRIKSAAKNFSVDHVKEILSREDWKELVVLHPIIGYEVIVNFAP